MRVTQAAVKSCDTNLLFEKTLFCSHRKDPLVAFCFVQLRMIVRPACNQLYLNVFRL